MSEEEVKQPGVQPAQATDASGEVVEGRPLSVVVDTTVAEPTVQVDTAAEIPVAAPPTVTVPTEKPRIPQWYWLLAAVGVCLMLMLYKGLYSPLLVHLEDSIERRVLGEKIYEARQSDPHTTRQKSRWFFSPQ